LQRPQLGQEAFLEGRGTKKREYGLPQPANKVAQSKRPAAPFRFIGCDTSLLGRHVMINPASVSNRRFDRSKENRRVKPTAPRFKLKFDGQTRELTYQDAFAHAYDLAREGRMERAERIFEALCGVSDRGPRARIMLARCRAQRLDFQGSKTTLDETFSAEPALACGLHDAFVLERFGMRKDAVQELAPIANERRDLPTICLLLGDLLAEDRKLDKAQQCWKLAVKRDRPDGAVGLLARRALQRLATGVADPS